MFTTHRPTLTLQLHNYDLFRTCRNALLRGSWQDFNWHDASRGPSAIAELLVYIALDAHFLTCKYLLWTARVLHRWVLHMLPEKYILCFRRDCFRRCAEPGWHDSNNSSRYISCVRIYNLNDTGHMCIVMLFHTLNHYQNSVKRNKVNKHYTNDARQWARHSKMINRGLKCRTNFFLNSN